MKHKSRKVLSACFRWIFRKELWHVYVQRDEEEPVRLNMGHHDWHIDYTADPFLFRKDGENWLFYETLDPNDKGVLGCFKEENGKWTNWGKVLEQPCHLSYPQVFENGGRVFMIPESSDNGKGTVDLYETKSFPAGWLKVATLIPEPSVDSTLLKKDGVYYLFCCRSVSPCRAELWISESLTGPWHRHPQAVNINQSYRLRRNGGSFQTINGQLCRVAQDCNGAYGKRLFAVPILELSQNLYREGNAFLLMDGRKSVFHNGRHTYNTLKADGHHYLTFDVQDFHLRPLSRILSNIDYLLGRRFLRKYFANKPIRP